jgi:uncharacterized protein YeaO (DUF488 family)
MLKTNCITSEREASDGTRISVMSHHTLQDGHTPNPMITSDLIDEWLPWLAPPARLLGGYYKRGLVWEEFAAKYMDFMRTPPVETNIKQLATRALEENISLLCIENTPECCHRRLLAGRCQELEPDLIVDLR